MLQMEEARAGRTTPEMKSVAEEEGIEIQDLRERIARGEVIIPLNRKHESVKVVGIGSGLRTKVNANTGTSTDYADISIEVEKARVAVRAGADTIMDLSTSYEKMY